MDDMSMDDSLRSRRLRDVGGRANVRVVNPLGRREGEPLLPGVEWCDDPYKADLSVIRTEWNEYRALDLGKVSKKMVMPRVAHLRNIYSARNASSSGFASYIGIGL